MKLWQNRIISIFDLPFGSKSAPPLPPPSGIPVKLFLNTCSKAKNFRILKFTVGEKRRPPLYGPIALFIWTRYPRLRSEEHTSELQSRENLVCRLLLEKKK